jgi:O-methyltransferase
MVPVERWPARLASYFGIATPATVVARPEPSPGGNANVRILLELLQQTAGVAGDVAECGVHRGRTLVAIALAAEQQHRDATVLGFDTFAGFGDAFDESELAGASDRTKSSTGFSDTSIELVRRKLGWLGLTSRVHLVEGYFADTLPSSADREFAFVHLDCDLYESYRECLEFFHPRLATGAIVLFDEYNDPPWPGCNRAVDEFLDARPEQLERIERDNYQRWYYRKL